MPNPERSRIRPRTRLGELLNEGAALNTTLQGLAGRGRHLSQAGSTRSASRHSPNEPTANRPRKPIPAQSSARMQIPFRTGKSLCASKGHPASGRRRIGYDPRDPASISAGTRAEPHGDCRGLIPDRSVQDRRAFVDLPRRYRSALTVRRRRVYARRPSTLSVRMKPSASRQPARSRARPTGRRCALGCLGVGPVTAVWPTAHPLPAFAPPIRSGWSTAAKGAIAASRLVRRAPSRRRTHLARHARKSRTARLLPTGRRPVERRCPRPSRLRCLADGGPPFEGRIRGVEPGEQRVVR